MIDVEKKNPYKFTLGFDKTKPSHVRAAEILNSVKDKADLIASAVVAHIDGVRMEDGSGLNSEALQVIIQELVKQEVKKVMQLYPEEAAMISVEKNEQEKVVQIQNISEARVAPEVAKSVRDAMSAFRNR